MKQCQAILDVGTSKVVCLIGFSSGKDQFDVYGVGSYDYDGIKKGRLTDPMSLRVAVKKALDAACNESKRRPRTVFVGVPGCFITLKCAKGELDFGEPRIIDGIDVDRMIDDSKQMVDEPEDSVHIHGVAVSFKVDGAQCNIVPIGQQASTFSGIVGHIYMDGEYARLMDGIIEENGLEVIRYVDTVYTESILLMDEAKKSDDLVFVDVGAFAADICVIRNCAPIFRKTLPIGGAHFAQDLSICLKMPASLAEDIKRRHVFGLDYTGRRDSYKLDDGRVEDYDYETIQEIIEARATELASMLVAAFSDRHMPIDIKPEIPVYLTGGGFAMMRGSREFLQSRINQPVVAELPLVPRLGTANYVSAYAILNYACAFMSNGTVERKENRILQAFVNFFTK